MSHYLAKNWPQSSFPPPPTSYKVPKQDKNLTPHPGETTLFIVSIVGLVMSIAAAYPFISPVSLMATLRAKNQATAGKWVNTKRLQSTWIINVIGTTVAVFEILTVLTFIFAIRK